MTEHPEDFLKRNRELCEVAMEAPWTTFQWGDGSQARSGMFNVACDSAETVIVKDIFHNDASFIAASRTSLPLALELLSMALETIEQLSMGHGVPLAAAMAPPPERYRIMAKELNEMLQERTVFAREALAALETKAGSV